MTTCSHRSFVLWIAFHFCLATQLFLSFSGGHVCCVYVNGGSLCAQTPNRYNLSEESYRLFTNGQKHRDDEMALVYSDSLMRAATILREPKARVFALTLKLNYYQEKDLNKMHEVGKELREECLKQRNEDYFYYSYSIEIFSYVTAQHPLLGLQLADEMRSIAIKNQSEKGILSCYQSMAFIYSQMRDNEQARRYYRSAIKESLRLNSSQTSYLYRNLAYLTDDNIYERDSLYEESMRYADNETDSLYSMLDHCTFAGMADHRDSFFSKYAIVESMIEQHGLPLGKENWITVQCIKATFDGDREMAMTLAKSLTYPAERLNMQLFVSRHFDYKEAYLISKAIIAFQDSITHVESNYYLAALAIGIDNWNLIQRVHMHEQELAQMKLEHETMQHNQMELRGRQLILERETRLKEAEHLRLYEDSVMHSKEIIRKESERTLAEAANEAIMNGRIRIRIILTIVILVALIVFYTINNIHKKRAVNSLVTLANDLREARNEAIKANDLKNKFIRNMNREVRTPLNTVIGFSQVLADEDINLSDSDKADYSKYIYDAATTINHQMDEILEAARNDYLTEGRDKES